MFAVLDTDHFSELARESKAGLQLRNRLLAEDVSVFLTIVTAHEALGGWLAVVNRFPAGSAQVDGYLQFRRSLQAMMEFDLLDFDDVAAERLGLLRVAVPRLGTMDLKIAAICLTHDATLLTRNVRDFNQIPGLRVENWLD